MANREVSTWDDNMEQTGLVMELRGQLRAANQRAQETQESLEAVIKTGAQLGVEKEKAERQAAELAAANVKLHEFFSRAMRTAWEGGDIDGGSIQSSAIELGLARIEPYDPQKHNNSSYGFVEPGDDWYINISESSASAILDAYCAAREKRLRDAVQWFLRQLNVARENNPESYAEFENEVCDEQYFEAYRAVVQVLAQAGETK